MPPDPAALLRSRGIQVTAQRLAVLRAVNAEPHITADAVAGAVRTAIGAISLQSVYDALGLLVSEGLLRRIQPPGSPARYEDRVGDNHHHLICRTCGAVVDIDCAIGAAPCLAPDDDRGYEIDEAEVAYWGRCPACLGQASAPRPAAARQAARPDRATSDSTTRSTPPAARRRAPHPRSRRSRRPSKG